MFWYVSFRLGAFGTVSLLHKTWCKMRKTGAINAKVHGSRCPCRPGCSGGIKEVAGHGVHAGAARAIAVVSTMSEADFRQWEPVFPEWGAAREDFNELVDDLSLIADAIIDDVSLDGVVNNLFGEESD